jgi:methionyl-tRNA synthetase
MSKSLGNVIDPFDAVQKYGLEPVRYYLLKEIPAHADGDFSQQRFHDVYEADLANGIGNLASRIAKLAEKAKLAGQKHPVQFQDTFTSLMQTADFDKALQWIKLLVIETDQFLSEKQPWKQTADEQVETISTAIVKLLEIAYHLQPFMPKTASHLLKHFTANKIVAIQPLFPRLTV